MKADANENEGAATEKAEFSVDKLVNQFEDAFDNTQVERANSELARDYYDGYQLSDEELAALRKRGQPPVISNRIGPKIDSLLGYERKMRTQPKAYPRTPQHEDDADSVTDSIRFVCESNKFDEIRSAAAENLFIEGIGAATVTVEEVNKRFEVRIRHVPWDRFYRDDHSRDRNFKDASFMGVVLWMDEEDAKQKFPGKDDIIESCYSENEALGNTFDDRPRVSWGDRKRHRVRVLQHRFKHDGKWYTCVMCRAGFLRDPQVSPYVDEHGEPVCDLIAVSAYVDRENRRYGVVNRHISPQDEINKRRSKALHLLNSQTVIAEKGAVESVKLARSEVARPDGYVEVHPNMRFELDRKSDLVNGQFQLLQESKNEIDASGINPALGGQANAPSGRAQEMLVQGGLAEMEKVFDGFKHWSWEIYRQVWYRIRQYWKDERWIRITDDERNLRWVSVNHPVTMGEALTEKAKAEGQPPPQIDPNDPQMKQVVMMRNHLPQLDVDVILEDGPDSITVQSEQFEQLVKLKQSDPNSIPAKAIIEASSLRNKEQILQYIESNGIPPEVQKKMQDLNQQLQDAQQKLQSVQIDAQKNQVTAAKNADEHAYKLQQLQLEEYNAETARISALKDVNSEYIQALWPISGISNTANNNGTGSMPQHSPPQNPEAVMPQPQAQTPQDGMPGSMPQP